MSRIVSLAACALLLAGCTFVVELDGDSHTVRVRPLVPTQDGSPLPTVTPTPTVAPTATPAPTTVSTPTATPWPSPTPELTPVPTITPRPTLPPPDEQVCMAGVRTTSLNVRADHSTNAAVVGRLAQGTRVQVFELWIRYPEGMINREEWGRITTGWIAIWHNGSQLAVLDDSEGCWEIPIAYASAKPASPFGLHLIFSAGGGALTVSDLGVLKGTDGTEWIIRAAKTQRPDVLTLWRNLSTGAGVRDCPPLWGRGDPRVEAELWWGEQYATWQARGLLGYVDYWEVVNECGAPSPPWERDFWLRTLEMANAANVCLAVFSDAYGTPELITWNARRPILDAMLEKECVPGRHHVLSLHNYEGAQSGEWKFGRWRLIMTLLGDRYRAIPILFTEYGYATGDAPADCPRFWADWLLAEREFRADAQIWGAAHFSVGGGTKWTDLARCL